MPLYLIEGPVVPAVSLADMKRHLRVEQDDTDDDDLITAFTAAVTQHLEGRDGRLGRAFMAQTWELRCDGFPCDYVGSGYLRTFRANYAIELPLAPLIEVESVQYYDADDVLRTAATDTYDVVGVGGFSPGQVILRSTTNSWPAVAYRSESVIVTFRAGYVDTSDSPPTGEVPAPIVAAIKLLTANLYENRQTVVLGQTAIEMPWAAEALLQPYRIYSH